MTVISTLITRYCTVHASDSLIVTSDKHGSRKPIEWTRPKIVAVRPWRGAMAYWGLAKYNNWDTAVWLQKQAGQSGHCSSPEGFARDLTDQLSKAISGLRFAKAVDSGIGIHFTAYEYVADYWIPELFLISNYTDPSYQSVSSDGLHLSRETYSTLTKQDPDRNNHKCPIPEHREKQYRLAVHDYLHSDKMFIYNNGDPVLFNAAAYAVFGMFRVLAERKILINFDNMKTWHNLALRLIKIVSETQRDFCKKETQVVGGKLHALAISPNGECFTAAGARY